MTDEEAMEALLNSGVYSFPTWTLKLGLPTDEMCLVMSLIASDEAPIPVDVAYISEYLHMDGAVVEASVKELLDRRLVYKKDSYLILDLEMCDHIFDAAATVRQAKLTLPIVETRGFSVLRGLPSGTVTVPSGLTSSPRAFRRL